MSKETFQRVVENALDFLDRAIDDLNDRPKHSVIAFYTGVELFLKARLIVEHWSLTVSRRQDPDLEAFLKGDFASVTLDEAANRLDKAVGSGLTQGELQTFKRVGQHRNKMVHFFHEAASQQEKTELRLAILKEQLTAWHALNRLISDRWRDVFAPWRGQIDAIEIRLRAHRQYLDAAFEHSRPAIEAARAEGFQIYTCPSCGYDADKHADEEKKPYRSACFVCGLTQTALRIACPKCEEPIIFRDDGYAQCGSCGHEVVPAALAEEIDDGGARHAAAMDGEDAGLGNCSECDGYHTIATLESGTYFCADCFTEFEDLNYCGWCNEPNSGDMEFSHWSGCNHCDGRVGNERDD